MASPLRQALAQHPKALVFGDEVLSGPQLLGRADRVQATWRAMGIGRGDRILAAAPSLDGKRTDDALLTHAIAAHVVDIIAALDLGCVWIPYNPHLGAAEREHLIVDADPALIIGEGQRTPRGPKSPEGDALIIYTSGTTGKSKGCVHSLDGLVDATRALMQAWEMQPSDTVVHTLPLFHVHGLCVALLGALLSGATTHLLPGFSPKSVVEAVAGGGTVFMGVPTMYRRLVDHLDQHPSDAAVLQRARLFCSGSAALAVADFDAFLQHTGHAIVERYGMSETLITLTNPLHGERKRGSVGLPIAGVVARINDGELQVSGPGVMRGYFNNEKATHETLVDGFLRTGDAATIDADGYIRIAGRLSTDFAKIGGHKVSLVEVEHAIAAHVPLAALGISDVCVVAIPDAEWGERLVVCVVATAPVALHSIVNPLQTQLPKHQWPRGLCLCELFPRNAMGKLQKRALAQRISEGSLTLQA